MRRLAFDLERDGADAAGGQRQAVAVDTRGFAREHRILLRTESGQRGAGTGRADFLIAVDQHRQRAVVLELHLLQDGDGMQDHRHTVLVVGDAKTIGTVAIDAERLLGQHTAQVDGVHMSDQHDLARAGALELCHHHLADLLGRIGHAVDLGRLDQPGVTTQRGQAVADKVGDAIETFEVLAARFDGDQVLQRGDQGRLFLLRKLVSGFHRRGLGGLRQQRGGERGTHRRGQQGQAGSYGTLHAECSFSSLWCDAGEANLGVRRAGGKEPARDIRRKSTGRQQAVAWPPQTTFVAGALFAAS